MKTMIRHIASYLLAAAVLAGAAGCVDDFRPDVGTVGEGETAVDVTVEFDLVDPVDITSRAGADDVADGDIMDAVSSFHMVLYTKEGAAPFADGKTYAVAMKGAETNHDGSVGCNDGSFYLCSANVKGYNSHKIVFLEL